MKYIRLMVLFLFAFQSVSLCSDAMASKAGEKNKQPLSTNQEYREEVEDVFAKTTKDLKGEEFDNVSNFLDSNFYGGFSETRDNMEDTWKNEQVIDLDFTINNILKSPEGLLDVSVTWRKLYLDANGNQQKKTGSSEIILKPGKKGYKILSVKGDQFY
ncbi:MAG: hypothetical protein HQL29_04835 [Candidatus Omnitrophica bacterium]|nr:hypothetical protein [Candidatus Omnitrophota bacterium]